MVEANKDSNTSLDGYDEEQIRLMEERCILVDTEDKNIGSDTKKNCHMITKERDGILHRAFSVFLFDLEGRLLLQQRADEKITFPNYFTNTCCSHPLSFPAEIEEDGQIGVKKAAQRKLEHELGIPKEQVPLENFKYLTRIHYKSASDEKWIEHEMDYILIIKAKVDLNVNPNEVKSVRYVNQDELKQLFVDAGFYETEDISKQKQQKDLLLTPWFQLIYKNFLTKWWNQLDTIHSVQQDDTIHHML
ncbi:hypothetical protein BB558_000055 [Smittium angustum]|uniref:isopentenyl-diphosphate Delta-isomerase n=1 Tax=Smittium angustum TaxID=133377 RepID=A0A2U1JFM6_SMIAN|nr:hypothetical protein BB558_000055 [Smittium angustum]